MGPIHGHTRVRRGGGHKVPCLGHGMRAQEWHILLSGQGAEIVVNPVVLARGVGDQNSGHGVAAAGEHTPGCGKQDFRLAEEENFHGSPLHSGPCRAVPPL